MLPPGRWLNRELAWLDFNARVLEEAEDPSVPLLERVKFLAIFSSNLDEFFMVRVAGVRRQVEQGSQEPWPDGRLPTEVLAAITARVRKLVDKQHQLFLSMVPELAAAGVEIVRPAAWTAEDRAWAESWFTRELHPLLTPMAVDPGHPFPHLANRAICLIVELDPLDDLGMPQAQEVVIHLPAGAIPRFLRLPGGPCRFVLLEDVLRTFLNRMFAGYHVRSSSVIRVTRDNEIELEDTEEDLLHTVEDAVKARRMGAAVRLQHEQGISANLLDTLVRELEMDADCLFPTAGPTALTDLWQLYTSVARPELRDPPLQPRRQLQDGDVFSQIRARDVLVHHPYEDFECVSRFITEAAHDPHVLAIRMTLYRVAADSAIAQALASAAGSGKQVTVLVELRARFSEEGNIAWARRLEASGAHVVYGIVGLKTHCKAALVVRREEGGVRRYCHLGTGNYNANTAKTYTDHSLFTADEAIGEDLTHVFNLLTGYVRPPPLRHLVWAPVHLRTWLVDHVRREAENARSGKPASIVAKLNALVDGALIDELYLASQAGVQVDLILRGMCCLRPGVPGLSENIRVRRIVDRFLEHTRILRFEEGGAPTWWLASADWMPRNLDGRIELAFPVLDPRLQAQVQHVLDLQLADTTKARLLGPDGEARRPEGPPLRCQVELARTSHPARPENE